MHPTRVRTFVASPVPIYKGATRDNILFTPGCCFRLTLNLHLDAQQRATDAYSECTNVVIW